MHHNTQLPFPYVIILFMYKHSLTRDCYFDVVNSISPHLPRCYTDVDRVRQTGGNTRSGDKDILMFVFSDVLYQSYCFL